MKYDVVVIGGSAAGIISAKTAKLDYPEKSVLVIRKEEISLIPCSIPYTFSTLKSVDDGVMSIEGPRKLGIEFLIDEVVSVDTENKSVKTSRGKEVGYNKLVFATGSTPVIPPIEGAEADGVYSIPKDYEYIKKVQPELKGSKNLVVIGAGFIGMEMSDELRKEVEKVTLVEALDGVLPLAFDKDVSDYAAKAMSDNGIDIRTSSRVKRILNENGKVSGVELDDSTVIEADAVILSIGYKANARLAMEAGLHMGITGGIWVDEYMRTSVKDVFAAGDCVEHKCFFTRKPSKLMLASTATFEARIAGGNLFGLKMVREKKGNIAIFSTSIEGVSLGSAGKIEKSSLDEGFEIVVGEARSRDRHPGCFSDSSLQYIKLVFAGPSGILLGAQVVSGKSAGEMVNILGVAIQNEMTATDLATLQFGTHPLLTSAPTTYPIVDAAKNALRKIGR
ncbi:MAG TPA: FAD-dependent oxidoreductase [Candidatus Krumholzibacteriaceae bacterium]|nr:FAD-dependent oxidoreductase [Candidatus Krumholzibacteriaceae bacterium]